jgi:enamine deaminase RidA (YjgF/YER057c/UK114 family)
LYDQQDPQYRCRVADRNIQRRRRSAGECAWLSTAGTPGLAPDGSLAPDITGQAEAAWAHIVTLLEKAGMTIADVVKVTQYLVRADDIPAYAKVRARFLGAARPASTLLVVPALVRPDILLEVEVQAAKA